MLWVYIFTFKRDGQQRLFTCEVQAPDERAAAEAAWDRAERHTGNGKLKGITDLFCESYYGPYQKATITEEK